jgi:hypothetical protein
MSLYKKRYSDKGLRMQSWDYGWNGNYHNEISGLKPFVFFCLNNPDINAGVNRLQMN